MQFEKLSRDEMERRRLEGAQLLNAGWGQARVARTLQVSRTCASRWATILRNGGPDALHKRRASGRPCRLTGTQLHELLPALWATREEWTFADFADSIRAAFGVTYYPDHVGRIIHRLGLRAKRARKSKVAEIGGGN